MYMLMVVVAVVEAPPVVAEGHQVEAEVAAVRPFLIIVQVLHM